MEDLFSKNWIKVDGSGRIRCGCGMVESDNLIFIKKLLQNCQVHVQAIPEKQTLHWFRRSSKQSEDPQAENGKLNLPAGNGIWSLAD